LFCGAASEGRPTKQFRVSLSNGLLSRIYLRKKMNQDILAQEINTENLKSGLKKGRSDSQKFLLPYSNIEVLLK